MLRDADGTVNIEEMQRYIEEWNKKNPPQPVSTPVYVSPYPCPHCGYCPHCGRGGHSSYPQPYWQPYPLNPVVTW